MAIPKFAPERDDASLAAAAAAGDLAARRALADRWGPAIWRFCLRILANDQDAWDCSQEAMTRVFAHLATYDPSRPFGPWAYGIARNTCIDDLRRRRRSWEEPGDLPSTDACPQTQAALGQRNAHLHDALASLAPMYREILVLYHFEHLRYVDIAETLGLPLGTVMNRIFRARRQLRETIGDPEALG
jgi:RNA polymerase sigma-70 factor (ECF subfamily)